MRDRPTTAGSQVLLLAMAGEQFAKLGEQGGWLRVSNGRGTGWSFGDFWQACSTSRAAVEDDGQGGAAVTDRAADGPGAAGEALPGWAYGLIGFAVGAAAAVAIGYVVLAIRAASGSGSDKDLPLMEHKVGSAGSSSVIPQVRRRNSFGKL